MSLHGTDDDSTAPPLPCPAGLSLPFAAPSPEKDVVAPNYLNTGWLEPERYNKVRPAVFGCGAITAFAVLVITGKCWGEAGTTRWGLLRRVAGGVGTTRRDKPAASGCGYWGQKGQGDVSGTVGVRHKATRGGRVRVEREAYNATEIRCAALRCAVLPPQVWNVQILPNGDRVVTRRLDAEPRDITLFFGGYTKCVGRLRCLRCHRCATGHLQCR